RLLGPRRPRARARQRLQPLHRQALRSVESPAAALAAPARRDRQRLIKWWRRVRYARDAGGASRTAARRVLPPGLRDDSAHGVGDQPRGPPRVLQLGLPRILRP